MKRPGILGRSPAKSRFGNALTRTFEDYDAFVARASFDDEPNRVVLRSALAGATVALGTYEGAVLRGLQSVAPAVAAPHLDGGVIDDPMVRFARELHGASDEAYRVVVWAVLTEYAAHFWAANYDYEIRACEQVFRALVTFPWVLGESEVGRTPLRS